MLRYSKCQNNRISVQCVRFDYTLHIRSITLDLCIIKLWHILFFYIQRCGVNRENAILLYFLFFFFVVENLLRFFVIQNDWTLASLCNWRWNWVNSEKRINFSIKLVANSFNKNKSNNFFILVTQKLGMPQTKSLNSSFHRQLQFVNQRVSVSKHCAVVERVLMIWTFLSVMKHSMQPVTPSNIRYDTVWSRIGI